MSKKFLVGLIVVAMFALQPILSAAYIAIVDAGSSGSRMHLFDIENTQSGITFEEVPLINNTNSPGISDLAATPEKIPDYMDPLIVSLRNGLPKGVSEGNVSFYFIATAGMRVVSPTLQEAVYSELENYLKTETSFQVKYVGTCSGKMEGTFDWIALNCIEGKIGSGTTDGIMDMGGASLEVAYADNKQSKHAIIVTLGDKTYFVHSCSYLGLGADLMREQYTANPDCFPKGLKLADVTGNGKYHNCLSDLQPLIYEVQKVQKLPPSVAASTKFVGISNFFYVLDSNPFNLGSEVTISSIKKEGENFATIAWEDMEKQWPGDQFLFSYYINSAFMVDFFDALGFGHDTQIEIVNKINNTSVGWALGAAVYYAEGNGEN